MSSIYHVPPMDTPGRPDAELMIIFLEATRRWQRNQFIKESFKEGVCLSSFAKSSPPTKWAHAQFPCRFHRSSSVARNYLINRLVECPGIPPSCGTARRPYHRPMDFHNQTDLWESPHSVVQPVSSGCVQRQGQLPSFCRRH